MGRPHSLLKPPPTVADEITQEVKDINRFIMFFKEKYNKNIKVDYVVEYSLEELKASVNKHFQNYYGFTESDMNIDSPTRKHEYTLFRSFYYILATAAGYTSEEISKSMSSEVKSSTIRNAIRKFKVLYDSNDSKLLKAWEPIKKDYINFLNNSLRI